MLVLFFLDSDEMMNADVFLVLQNVFGSLRFGHKVEYLSGARDIRIGVALWSHTLRFTQLKDTI